jgi:hypothetical protein
MMLKGENPLKCTAQNEKDLVIIVVFSYLYFDPHQN